MKEGRLVICCVVWLCGCLTAPVVAQNMTDGMVSYAPPKEYQIADITVSGVNFLDNNALIHLSGLKVGQRVKIPQ